MQAFGNSSVTRDAKDMFEEMDRTASTCFNHELEFRNTTKDTPRASGQRVYILVVCS